MQKDSGDKLKELSKAILERDIKRKMRAKLRNVSYEPWKNPLVTVKDTPFGNFGGGKKKSDFDFSKPPQEYLPAAGSINVCRLASPSAGEGRKRQASRGVRGKNAPVDRKAVFEASRASWHAENRPVDSPFSHT